MKAIIFALLAVVLFTGGLTFSGCQSAAQKEQAAQDELEAARLKAIELEKATEWNEFKSEYEAKILDNEIRILELKEKMRESGNKADAALIQRIENLELKNKDFRIRITNYDQSQTDWEAFKREFNRDMDELGKALKDLTVDNKK